MQCSQRCECYVTTHCMYCNISSVVEFYGWWVLKSKIEINILKGNHCILRTRGAPVRQKLGMTLENKVVQKLKLEKNVFYKKWSPELIFLNECFFEKILSIFDTQN